MANKEDTKIALKKKIHMRWTSTQEEIDKTIDYIVDSICAVCANNLTEQIKKEKMNPEELEKYEKELLNSNKLTDEKVQQQMMKEGKLKHEH